MASPIAKDMYNMTRKVYCVPAEVLESHELYLLKSTLAILGNEELISGALDKQPLKQPDIPTYTIKERLSDNNDSYVLGKGDQNGETKIDKEGNLQGGRHFLFPTFTYSTPTNNKSPNRYVLVSHLISALNLDMKEESFLLAYPDLYPMEAEDHIIKFLKDEGVVSHETVTLQYITARSAFLRFGAAVLASASRVIDDYWEQLTKEQGFKSQHRVYVIPSKIINLVSKIDPRAKSLKTHAKETLSDVIVSGESEVRDIPQFENPLLTITELPPLQVRKEYINAVARGESVPVIPGQTIHGSIELSNAYKIPKYHYKNSFIAAQQHDALDTAIGSHTHPVESHNFGRGRKANYVPPEESDELSQIPGWKFTSLPVSTQPCLTTTFSAGGLPVYEKGRLPDRLKHLTPNQIKELERSHDVVQLNTALGQVRKIRNNRWTKYWQHKTGIPVGLTVGQDDYFRNEYLKNTLKHVEVNIVPNEIKNVDEKRTIKRVPNPNFLGYSNVTGFKPPYVEKS